MHKWKMLTFGCAKQGLLSKPQQCLDSRNTRWYLLLYKWTYPLTNTEEIVRRNVLVQIHLQDQIQLTLLHLLEYYKFLWKTSGSFKVTDKLLKTTP